MNNVSETNFKKTMVGHTEISSLVSLTDRSSVLCTSVCARVLYTGVCVRVTKTNRLITIYILRTRRHRVSQSVGPACGSVGVRARRRPRRRRLKWFGGSNRKTCIGLFTDAIIFNRNPVRVCACTCLFYYFSGAHCYCYYYFVLYAATLVYKRRKKNKNVW